MPTQMLARWIWRARAAIFCSFWTAAVFAARGEATDAGAGAAAVSPEPAPLLMTADSVLPTTHTAGITSVGTNEYPNAGLTLAGAYVSDSAGFFTSACMDAAAQYGYLIYSIVPGYAVKKVKFGPPGELPTYVGEARALTFQSNWGATGSVYDDATRSILVGTVKGRIEKFDAGGDGEKPTAIGTCLLNDTDFLWFDPVLDPAGRCAYFGVQGAAGNSIVQIAVGESNEPPRRLTTLDLNSGEGIDAAVIDADRGYAYFAGGSQIVKIALGRGGAPPRRMGSFQFPDAGHIAYGGGAIDVEAGVAYFLLDNAQLLKIALGEGNAPPTRIGVAAIPGAFFSYNAKTIFNPHNHRIIVTGEPNIYADVPSASVDVLALLEPGDPTGPPVYIGSEEINRVSRTWLFDGSSDRLYAGGRDSPDGCDEGVATVNVGDTLQTITLAGITPLSDNDKLYSAGAIDVESGYVYFQGVGALVKLKITDGVESPERVSSLQLDPHGGGATVSAMDAAGGRLYIYHNAELLKLALGAGDAPPSIVARTGIPYPSSLALDAAGGYIYASGASAGSVFKIPVGEGDNAFGEIEEIRPPGAGDFVQASIVDSATGNGLHSIWNQNQSYYQTLRIAKVAATSEAGAARFGGELAVEDLRTAEVGISSPEPGIGYFVTTPGTSSPYETIVIKVAFGSGDSTPTLLGRYGVPENAYNLYAAFDANSENVYLKDQYNILKMSTMHSNLNVGNAYRHDTGLGPLVADHKRGFLYSGTSEYPPRIEKIGTSQKGFLKLTRINLPRNGSLDSVAFYSHAAGGKVRLSLYKDKRPRTLVWQSGAVANGVAGGWLTVPAGNGTPGGARTLPKGDYWLGWEIDSPVDIPSYVAGVAGSGGYLTKEFDAAAPDLDQTEVFFEGVDQVDANWSEYLTYSASAVVRGDVLDYLLGKRVQPDGLDFNLDGGIDVSDYLEAIKSGV